MRWLFESLGWLLALLPRRLVSFAGWTLGLLWFYLVRIRRRHTLAHLAAASIPSADTASERRRIARQVYVNQATNVLEMASWRRLWRALQRETPPAWIEISGREHLDAALQSGRGVLVLSAHMGNYDLMMCHQALTLGRPLHVLTKRLSWRALNDAWLRTRARFGVHALPEDEPLAPALKVLREGGVVLTVLDQHAPEQRAIELPFLGLPARTSRAFALLALRSRSAVLPCFAFRRPGGRHQLVFKPLLSAPREGSLNARIHTTTQRAIDVIEDVVREEPGQWLWLHRRWKDDMGQPLVSP